MAFSATIDKVIPVAPGSRKAVGSWSQTLGGADGSMTLAGGQVYSAHFQNHDGPSRGSWGEPLVTWTTSNGIITLTVKAREAVTKGRFDIVYA